MAGQDRTEIVKVKIFGVNSATSWFLHQTKCDQTLHRIVNEIFKGETPASLTKKVQELCGFDTGDLEVGACGAKFNTCESNDYINVACKVEGELHNIDKDIYIKTWILKFILKYKT